MLTNQQLINRKTGIGGSDAAAVCGFSKYRTPAKVYLEKLGLIEPEDFSKNESIYWGNTLEDIVRNEYIKRSGESVSLQSEMSRHPQYNFMIANVDGIIDNKKAIFEAKICSSFNMSEWGEPGTDEMPQAYLMQCAHYAAVYDADFVDLAVLFGHRWKFEVYRYHRNRKLENNLIAIEREFWEEHVLKKTPPEPKNRYDVDLLYGCNENEKVAATTEIYGKLLEYNQLKEKIAEYSKQADYFKDEIICHMKSAAILCASDSRIELASYKEQQNNRFDTNALKKVHPEIYNQFLKKSSFRVLRIKGKNL